MSDVLVLCYHALSERWEAALSVTPTALERQVGLLLRRGYRPTTFTQAVLAPPAPRTLAITFDDAFASVKTYAAPVLAALGAVATVFAPTAFMDGEGALRWPGLEEWLATDHAGELAAMSWAQLRELADAGWEIGSHTRTHPHLTQLDDVELARELEGSRADCERHLGRSCEAIAYPYGDVDQRVAAAAQRAGYAVGAALSSRLAPLGPHRQPRVGVYHGDDPLRFRLKVARVLRLARASRLWPQRVDRAQGAGV